MLDSSRPTPPTRWRTSETSRAGSTRRCSPITGLAGGARGAGAEVAVPVRPCDTRRLGRYPHEVEAAVYFCVPRGAAERREVRGRATTRRPPGAGERDADVRGRRRRRRVRPRPAIGYGTGARRGWPTGSDALGGDVAFGPRAGRGDDGHGFASRRDGTASMSARTRRLPWVILGLTLVLLAGDADPERTQPLAHLGRVLHRDRDRDDARVRDGRRVRRLAPAGQPARLAADDDGGRVPAGGRVPTNTRPTRSTRRPARFRSARSPSGSTTGSSSSAVAPVPLFLALFPTGAVASPRWRWLPRTLVVLFAVGIVGIDAPRPGPSTSPRASTRRTRRASRRSRRSSGRCSGSSASPSIALSDAGGRLARAPVPARAGEERQQIRWIAFVGLAALVSVPRHDRDLDRARAGRVQHPERRRCSSRSSSCSASGSRSRRASRSCGTGCGSSTSS